MEITTTTSTGFPDEDIKWCAICELTGHYSREHEDWLECQK